MVLLAYCMMLLIMSFNVGVLFMICTGLALGHGIFKVVGLPELPSNIKRVAGTGGYLPEADNCCNKIEAESADCPVASTEQQIHYTPVDHKKGYNF
jgi:hypothetical protein